MITLVIKGVIFFCSKILFAILNKIVIECFYRHKQKKANIVLKKQKKICLKIICMMGIKLQI